METTIDGEEFLSLTLALVTGSCYDRTTSETKRHDDTPTLSATSSDDDQSCEEGKILSLFQMREQMLKLTTNRNKTRLTEEEDEQGLQLIHQLLVSATSVNDNNISSAIDNLCHLYHNVSLTGDSVQRVAAYFADALVARLLTRESPFYDMIMKPPSPDEEFLAFAELYKVSPFYQFAHFTANQSIIEAFDKEAAADTNNNRNRSLHVIDFDITYGFQWPSLMQSLSEKATPTNRILLRITGFGTSSEQLQETESRLVSFARSFRNLAFEFHGLVRSSSKLPKPNIRKNETVAANLVFHLNSLNSYSKISETLKYVQSLRPSIVVVAEQEGSRKTHNFLSRFMESLHYFAAIFDSLDDCLPLDSWERLRIEKHHLGNEIKRVMNYDRDGEKWLRFERMETWKGRMERHGFVGVRQSGNSVMQAKLLLRIRSHYSNSSVHFDGGGGGFTVFERDDGKAISLGWQDRFLLTASSWSCQS